jgi:hypothetical protein
VSSYSKGTWVWITFVMTAMLLLIGIVEARVPSEGLSSVLMLGIIGLGYGSIFAWLYLHRASAKPQKQPRSLRLAGRVGEMSIYESGALEERLGAYVATQKHSAPKLQNMQRHSHPTL